LPPHLAWRQQQAAAAAHHGGVPWQQQYLHTQLHHLQQQQQQQRWQQRQQQALTPLLPPGAAAMRSSWPGGAGSTPLLKPLHYPTGLAPGQQQQQQLVWVAPGDASSDPSHLYGASSHAGVANPPGGPPAAAAAAVGCAAAGNGMAEHGVHGRSAGPRSSGGTVYCSASSAGSSVLADVVH
jgi:hypothetical protein